MAHTREQKQKQHPKETQTTKKSAPPVQLAPADHGGAALANRSAPKVPAMQRSAPQAPMRPDDTRRQVHRNVLAGALSDITLPYGHPLSAPPAPTHPDDKRHKLNRNTLVPARQRLAPQAPVRLDDARRQLNRNALARAISNGTSCFRRTSCAGAPRRQAKAVTNRDLRVATPRK